MLATFEYYQRGMAYYAKDDYDRAIADYTQAITSNPKYAAAYNARGLAYKAKGDYDRAIADYDQALKLDPNVDPEDEMGHAKRAEAYFAKGDVKKANEVLTEWAATK